MLYDINHIYIYIYGLYHISHNIYVEREGDVTVQLFVSPFSLQTNWPSAPLIKIAHNFPQPRNLVSLPSAWWPMLDANELRPSLFT